MIQFLRGTSAQRANHTEVSTIGQPIFETDTNLLYVGDGVTAIRDLIPVNTEGLGSIVMEDNADGTVTMNIRSRSIDVEESGNTIHITL